MMARGGVIFIGVIIMVPGMRTSLRQSSLGAAIALAVPCVAPAFADHGGALARAPMSPALVGVIAGALTLATGVAVAVIARLLTRKPPRSG
jgi:hypothetical protein